MRAASRKRDMDSAETKQKKADLEERMDRMVMRAMPQLPQRFKRFARKIENFDFRRTATLKAEIERDFTSLASQFELQDTDILRDMMELLGTPAFKDLLTQFVHTAAQMAKAEARADSRYSLLLRLVDEAHGKIPFMPWFVLKDHADPGFMFELQFSPADLIAEAEGESGEIRATAVLRALKDVAEPLYKLYINRIWLLSYIKEGEWPSAEKVPSFGNLVSETASRLDNFPSLVEVDAAWMRNSVSHNRRVYLPSEDAVEMWDEHKPRRKIPVSELLDKVKAMYQISAFTFPRIAQIYLFRTLLLRSGILDLVMEQMANLSLLDEATIEKAEKAIEAKAKTLFAQIEAFANSHIKAAT
jgi:hypothetical protein